jgi:transposase
MPDCDGAWKQLGEDVSEAQKFVPASFKVVCHARPHSACTCCDRTGQAPTPSHPINRSYACPGLLAYVFVGKYTDHLPLYS